MILEKNRSPAKYIQKGQVEKYLIRQKKILGLINQQLTDNLLPEESEFIKRIKMNFIEIYLNLRAIICNIDDSK